MRRANETGYASILGALLILSALALGLSTDHFWDAAIFSALCAACVRLSSVQSEIHELRKDLAEPQVMVPTKVRADGTPVPTKPKPVASN